MERLTELTTLTGNNETWHDNLSATDIAKFIQFENSYRNAVSFTATEAALVEELLSEIDVLTDEMDAIEWWVEDPLTGEVTLDSAQLELYEEKKAQLIEKLDEHAALVAAKTATLAAAMTSLQGIHASIGTQTTTSGQNLKTVDGLLLQRYAAGFSGFSTSDVAVLTQISEQCVGEGGEGVYLARALLAEQLDSTLADYDDECIEELGSRSAAGDAAEMFSMIHLTVVPNPADGMATVVLPEGHQLLGLKLMDALGRTVQIHEISKAQTVLDMDTGSLLPGVYFLVASNRTEKPVRFVVVH